MLFKKPKHYVGLDCHSDKVHVLPPTFQGVRALVNQVGEAAAVAAFPQREDEENSVEKSIVEQFIDELKYADKVERQTLVRDFQSYLDSLKASKPSAAGGEPGAEKEGAAAKAKATPAEASGEPAAPGAE